MNASQNDGTFSTWKTDDTVLMGDELSLVLTSEAT